jgi:anti-anti-sigma factor
MKLNITQSDGHGPLKIAGTLDIYSADTLRDALYQHLQSRPALALDLSGADACDVTALQLICSARKSAEAAGRPFTVTDVSPAVAQTCAAFGLVSEQLSLPQPT